MKITGIRYNQGADSKGNSHLMEIAVGRIHGGYTGKDGTVRDNVCTKIEEHKPEEGDDRWYYDLYFSSGQIARVFHVHSVFFYPELAE